MNRELGLVLMPHCELIETLWNVNDREVDAIWAVCDELIETLWNVN